MRILLSCAACLLALLASMPLSAADLSINAFAGKWQGNAVSESEVSVNFRLTSRDIDVEVRPSADGFDITWNTVQRQKGSPDNPIEKLKSTKLSFTGARDGVWRSTGNADPLASVAPYAWAHIKGDTLVITSLQVYADGRHELQIFRRSLSGTGMALEFVRLVDGEPVRRVSGRLIKVAG